MSSSSLYVCVVLQQNPTQNNFLDLLNIFLSPGREWERLAWEGPCNLTEASRPVRQR